jgi:hypothetical protein
MHAIPEGVSNAAVRVFHTASTIELGLIPAGVEATAVNPVIDDF